MAQWIWYWGDYEIYHSCLLHSRRVEMGADYPVMWKTEFPWTTVEFRREYESDAAGWVCAHTNGIGYVSIDHRGNLPTGEKIPLPAGKHTVAFRVTKTDGLPCGYVESDICPSDATWRCAHYALEDMPAGATPVYGNLSDDPEVFPFAYEHKEPVGSERIGDGILYDFGKETFGLLNIDGADASKKYSLVYGESREEALDEPDAVIREKLSGSASYKRPARAFRYVFLGGADESVKVSMEYEYLPLEYKGAFKCGDELINRVWDTAAYTFHLNSREFFLDGIKRDRWVWSGDAYQSYMVNNYLFQDKELARRTIIALRGKEPFEEHINTILDYSFYWVISLWDYYWTYGDSELLSMMYDKAVSLMKFCMDRRNGDGFVIGLPGEWVFIDWSRIDKTGACAAEQMLYLRALLAMTDIASLLGKDGGMYADEAAKLRINIDKFFWDDEKGAYIDSYESGKRNVTRHANILAVLYGFADESRRALIRKNVMLNDSITKITTPYFEFFELDAMCALGDLQYAADMFRSYWGGMIKLGATSIWEEFDPTETGAAHYAMYGHKYGRSLCHAWGSGPIFLLGRYFMGVTPTAPGYASFTVEPRTAQGLDEFSGTVPTPRGNVHVTMGANELRVLCECDGGTLRYNGAEYGLEAGKELVIAK